MSCLLISHRTWSEGWKKWEFQDALPTLEVEKAPTGQMVFLLAAALAPPTFSAHNHFRSAESQLGWEGSFARTGWQSITHTTARKIQRRESWEESGHGPDPKLFHRNLGSPGYQPGAHLSVSKLSRLMLSVILDLGLSSGPPFPSLL